MEENSTYSWSPKGSKPLKSKKAPDFGKLSKRVYNCINIPGAFIYSLKFVNFGWS